MATEDDEDRLVKLLESKLAAAQSRITELEGCTAVPVLLLFIGVHLSVEKRHELARKCATRENGWLEEVQRLTMLYVPGELRKYLLDVLLRGQEPTAS